MSGTWKKKKEIILSARIAEDISTDLCPVDEPLADFVKSSPTAVVIRERIDQLDSDIERRDVYSTYKRLTSKEGKLASQALVSAIVQSYVHMEEEGDAGVAAIEALYDAGDLDEESVDQNLDEYDLAIISRYLDALEKYGIKGEDMRELARILFIDDSVEGVDLLQKIARKLEDHSLSRDDIIARLEKRDKKVYHDESDDQLKELISERDADETLKKRIAKNANMSKNEAANILFRIKSTEGMVLGAGIRPLSDLLINNEISIDDVKHFFDAIDYLENIRKFSQFMPESGTYSFDGLVDDEEDQESFVPSPNDPQTKRTSMVIDRVMKGEGLSDLDVRELLIQVDDQLDIDQEIEKIFRSAQQTLSTYQETKSTIKSGETTKAYGDLLSSVEKIDKYAQIYCMFAKYIEIPKFDKEILDKSDLSTDKEIEEIYQVISKIASVNKKIGLGKNGETFAQFLHQTRGSFGYKDFHSYQYIEALEILVAQSRAEDYYEVEL